MIHGLFMMDIRNVAPIQLTVEPLAPLRAKGMEMIIIRKILGNGEALHGKKLLNGR